jgi:hypothetical protein
VTRRGQLVVLAAGVIAVALVPMLTAYLQLGYAADVTTTADDRSPTGDALRVLEGAVLDAASEVDGRYAWSERAVAAAEVKAALRPRIETVETALVDRGVVRSVAYNGSLASSVADEGCPGGPARRFGDCVADGGIVLQERAGDTHVVAVAVEVSSTTESGRATVVDLLPVP